MTGLKITRRFDDAEVTFRVTEDELVSHISTMPIDERLVLLRKLAGRDFEQLFPVKLLSGILKK